MASTKFDPITLVGTSFLRDLNRLFEDPAPKAAADFWTPAVDVLDRGDAFVVRAEVPGVDPTVIDVTLEDGVLTIRGERPPVDDASEDFGYRRREIVSGAFARKIRLAADVDIDAVSATSQNGILEVTVPKQPAELPRKVTVAVQR